VADVSNPKDAWASVFELEK